MTYKEAKEILEQKKGLIGKINAKGFQITTLLIVPSEENARNIFFQSYIINFNAEVSIAPFITNDVELWGIDENYLKRSNILFYEIIDK
jgi:hypothetical protein